MTLGCGRFQEALARRSIAPPAGILYSPWLRTRQTADIIAAAFGQADCQEQGALRPDSTVTAADHCVDSVHRATDAPAHVILVSHQPLVSQLVAFYLGAAANVPTLSPGALVTFSLAVPARDCGEVLFWASPPEFEAGL